MNNSKSTASDGVPVRVRSPAPPGRAWSQCAPGLLLSRGLPPGNGTGIYSVGMFQKKPAFGLAFSGAGDRTRKCGARRRKNKSGGLIFSPWESSRDNDVHRRAGWHSPGFTTGQSNCVTNRFAIMSRRETDEARGCYLRLCIANRYTKPGKKLFKEDTQYGYEG